MKQSLFKAKNAQNDTDNVSLFSSKPSSPSVISGALFSKELKVNIFFTLNVELHVFIPYYLLGKGWI